jgi:tryptophan 2,3-dioxygenase
MTLTYSNYLNLDKLLSLQNTRSNGSAHDETLFIVIHQVYELWFKEMLHEMDFLAAALERNILPRAQFTLRRILAIQRVLIDQLEVLETMTSGQFYAFRDLLENASGFQSEQFRELEFVLGDKRREIILSFREHSDSRDRLERRFHGITLWDAFLGFLSRQGYPIPVEVLQRDLTQRAQGSEAVQSVLLELYAKESEISFFCEMLLDLDEKFQEWRYLHAKMVERIIGAKSGTGGSTGAEYLKTTLFNPSFPDLWAIRSDFRKP